MAAGDWTPVFAQWALYSLSQLLRSPCISLVQDQINRELSGRLQNQVGVVFKSTFFFSFGFSRQGFFVWQPWLSHFLKGKVGLPPPHYLFEKQKPSSQGVGMTLHPFWGEPAKQPPGLNIMGFSAITTHRSTSQHQDFVNTGLWCGSTWGRDKVFLVQALSAVEASETCSKWSGS